MNPSIFKAYDIRGIYPSDLNEEGGYRIGRALATFTGAKKIAVGKDMRVSSDSLTESFIKGITDQGADVVDLGMVNTPMAYFASWRLNVDAAAIVTASHNPGEYNGFKFCLKDAVPVGEGSGMEEIKAMALEGNFEEAGRKGVVEKNDIKDSYYDYILRFSSACFSKKKIVIDFANGMGILDKALFERMREYVEPVFMYDDLDGNFPNHEANPLKTETLADLQKRVVEEGADLGIAYDGDADRVGFVDERGEVVPMDYVTALISNEVLKKYPRGLILMDLRSSNAVKEFIEEAGGKVNRCRVGHSLIKAQMRKEGAVFAGELSGHYFFEENSKAEMTGLAVVTMLNLMGESGKKMSELAQDLRRYHHSGEINSDVADKEAVFAKLKEKYADGNLDELDGIRIDFEDWWFNVRASNTEPKIRLNLEAKTKEMMEQKRDELLAIIRG